MMLNITQNSLEGWFQRLCVEMMHEIGRGLRNALSMRNSLLQRGGRMISLRQPDSTCHFGRD